MSEYETPFITLGQHLKFVREQSRQSLAEVSGAVEIDQQMLERIEAGIDRPAEDILLLLLSHFDVQGPEALQLWQLANYDGEVPETIRPEHVLGDKSVVMLLAMDMRTLYSDGLDITANQAGLTLTFTQAGGANNLPVARIGMSYEQAQKVSEVLQRVLLHAQYRRGPKLLPPPKRD